MTVAPSVEESSAGQRGAATRSSAPRKCPQCGSADVSLTLRGLAGATDERDQFFICAACGTTTYEIVARTRKELLAGRMEAGREVRVAGRQYTVSRVLRVGHDEHLVYLKPLRSEG